MSLSDITTHAATPTPHHTAINGDALLSDSAARAEALNPDRSFCVTAPAGSGKTELLTQRILALLPRVERPEQILAITFTRKAAAEMCERLVEKLDEAAAGQPVKAAHEQKTRDLALAALAHAKVKGWSLDPEQFNLRTIDSLCGELTRQMPILSAIGGAVEVTDQHRPLFLEAVAELMTAVGQPSLTGNALRALLLHFDNDWERLRDLLVALLERRGDWGQRLGQHHTPEESQAAVEDAVAGLTTSVLARARALIGAELSELETLAAHAADNLGRAAPILEANPERMADWRQVVGLLIKGDNKDWYKTWNKNSGFPPESKAEKAQLAELVGALKSRDDALFDTLVEIRSLPDMDPDDTGWELVLHLSHLLPVLLAQLLLIFRREGKVDFAHIALAAEDALGSDDEPTNLALRLDYQLEHILVDEFQDTSDQQMRLLKKLTRGWAEHNAAGGAPRTLFIVGDGMQSIYGFRYANVGLFLEARQQGVGGLRLEPLALTRNFRSQQGVVDWVNRVFKKLLPATDDPARGQVTHVWADATHPLLPGEAVSSHLFADDSGVAEAAFIADQIQIIRSQQPEASVAVLARARRHVLPLIAELQSRDIPYVGRDLENLRNTPTVMDLISLCRWLANPADEIAGLSLLRAPFCGLSLTSIQRLVIDQPRPLSIRSAIRSAIKSAPTVDMGSFRGVESAHQSDGVGSLEPAVTSQSDTSRPPNEPPGKAFSSSSYARLRSVLSALDWGVDHRDRLSLPVWIEQVWLRLGGHRVAGEEGYRDAERFFDLLHRAESEGVGLDMEWLDLRLEQLFAEHEPTGNPVELMTVHKSKGLQFDYVFMPQLHKGVSGNDRALLRWHLHIDYVDGQEQSGLIIAADDRRQKGEPSLYNYLNWLQSQKDAAELRRLLYVGVTRARNQVWLTAEAKEEPADDGENSLKAPGRSSPMGVLMSVIGNDTQHHLTSVSTSVGSINKASATNPNGEAPESYAMQPTPPLLRRVVTLGPDAQPDTAITFGQDAKQTGSDPVGLSKALRDNLYRVSNLRERGLGTALHRALELLSLRTTLPDKADGPIKAAIEYSLRESGLSAGALDSICTEVVAMVNTALSDPRGRWILAPHSKAYSELALMKLEEGEPKKYIIDRVLLAKDLASGDTPNADVAPGWWIVDYKSSRPPEGEALEAFYAREAREYSGQLFGYRELLAQVHGLDTLDIRCALYFPAIGGWWELR